MVDIKIDYNRGVQKWLDPSSGVEVYMYDDSPGKYLSNQGTPITEEFAKRAGVDIEFFRRQRIKLERMTAAKDLIEKELQADEGRKKTVFERDGWAIVHVGFGLHYIEDPDGTKITEAKLTLEQAHDVFNHLAPAKPNGKAKEKEAAPAKS